MGVALSEQETTISYCREGGSAHVWTSDATVMTKLDRMCREAPENYRCTEEAKAQIGGWLVSKSYVIADKNLISFRSRKAERILTEEQRAELRERGRRLKEAGF